MSVCEALVSYSRLYCSGVRVAGVVYEMVTKYLIGGVEIDQYKVTLPIKKGLSSSAALCVLVSRAFNRLYELKMTTHGEMDAAYRGEVLTPSRCGRLDQACAYGSTPVLLTFDSDQLTSTPLAVQSVLNMVIVDLKKAKDTKIILSALQKGFPFPETQLEKGVATLLGETNAGIVDKVVEALRQTNAAEQVGKLMTEAQRQFDAFAMPACPSQLTSPKLHAILSYPGIQHLIWGGKGVGSQVP